MPHSIWGGPSMRVKRRDFLGAGVGMALLFACARGGAGGYDVIVIGAIGILTALFAAQRGARVLVLEKASALGGTLFWSSGQIAGAGTVFSSDWGLKTSRPTLPTVCASTATAPIRP